MSTKLLSNFFKQRIQLALLPILFLMFFALPAWSQQQRTISGTVHSLTGDPLVGVSVVIVGEREGTQTDERGQFSISVKPEARLVITHVGYDKKEVIAKDGMDIQLVANSSDLSQVMVVGYGTQSRKKVTGAISTVNGDDIKNTPAVSFDAMLQGRIPGVTVQNSSGEPGSKSNIVIRGSTNMDYGNLNGGNTQPLYIIDGVIYDLNNMQGSYDLANPLSVIDPNNIESIEVLKDASAAAIYGARGGNGVIIVKTRRSQAKHPMVTLNVYGGATTGPRLIDVITGNAERSLKLGLLNDQLPYTDIYNGSIPIQLTDSLNTAFNNDVDWQGMMLRKNAYVNNEELTVSGSFDNKNTYRFGLSHYNEQGAVRGYQVERIAPNLDLQLNPVAKLSVGLSLQMSKEKRQHGGNISGNPYYFSTWSFPTSFAYLSDETVALYNGTANRFDDNNIFIYNANLRLTDTLTKDLHLTTTMGLNSYQDKYAYFSPVELNGVQNTAYDISANNPNWTWETFAQYDKHFKGNNLTLVGGFSAYQAKQYYAYMDAAGINVSGIYTLQTVPPGSNLYAYSTIQTKTTQSYYGRLNYDYNSKYLFTASFRRDASSIYSQDYRWGTFYALSGGWNVSDEKFFEPLKKTINSLKLRASYGVTGQDPGSWYAKYQQLYADASFLGATTGSVGGSSDWSYLTGTPSTYNGTTVVTPFPYNDNFASSSYKSSSEVRWEKYPQLDLGIDWSMFNNRINFVLDWYQKDAIDKYLWAVPAESTTGYAYYSGNYANVRNQGLELAINSTNMSPKAAFQWNTNFNISFNKGWVTKLPNEGKDMLFGESWWYKTLSMGEPLFTYRDYVTDGVYATEDDVPTDPITGNKMTYFGATVHAGDSKIIDQNGDYNINLDDKVNTGKSMMPTVTGGITNTFSYKGFSLSVFANYAYGNYLINGTMSDALNGSGYASWGAVAGPAGLYSQILNQFWMKNGDQTTYPRLVYGSGSSSLDPWNVARDYFLYKGGYFKIQQIRLGYTLPSKFVQRLHMRSVNVYSVFDNVHTFKQSKGLVDPTVFDYTTGSSNATYPTSLKFTLGLYLNF